MFIPSSLHPQLTLVHGPSQYFLVLKSPVPMISTKLVVINRSAVSANLKYTFGASWFWQPQSPQVRTCLSTYRYPSYLPTYLPTYLSIYLYLYGPYSAPKAPGCSQFERFSRPCPHVRPPSFSTSWTHLPCSIVPDLLADHISVAHEMVNTNVIF